MAYMYNWFQNLSNVSSWMLQKKTGSVDDLLIQWLITISQPQTFCFNCTAGIPHNSAQCAARRAREWWDN